MVKLATEQKKCMGRGEENQVKVEPALMSIWDQSCRCFVYSKKGSLFIIYRSRSKEALKLLFLPSFKYHIPSGPTS